jgi:tripartite-type tricarboxylate transporter receptor subunit TctC
MFDTISSSFAHIKAGKLRALGVTALARLQAETLLDAFCLSTDAPV